MKSITLILLAFLPVAARAQNQQDSLAIRQAALDYIESQHRPDPARMDRALHPRLVKRTFWKDRAANKDFLRETSAETMLIIAETYNQKGDKFPARPKKDIIFFDVTPRTASIKLVADDWIDLMHLVKLNGQWKIVNVVWEFNDHSRHQ